MENFINKLTRKIYIEKNNFMIPIEYNIKYYDDLILLLNEISNNQDFTNINLNYKGNKINLNKDNDNLILKINIYNKTDICKLMNNLPVNIDELVIKLDSSLFAGYLYFLEKSFSNLPFSLNKIQFIYPYTYKQYLSKKCTYYNILFDIKKPFNCKIFVYFGDLYNYIKNCCYDIIIINNSTIELKNNDEIHTINYVEEEQFCHRGGGGGLMQLVVFGATDVYLCSKK